MISVVQNGDGFVFAYAQWDCVDKDGFFDPQGEYLWVREVWIMSEYRRCGVLGELIARMDQHPDSKRCKYVYWEIVRSMRHPKTKVYDDLVRDNLIRTVSKTYLKEDIRDAIIKRSLSHV